MSTTQVSANDISTLYSTLTVNQKAYQNQLNKLKSMFNKANTIGCSDWDTMWNYFGDLSSFDTITNLQNDQKTLKDTLAAANPGSE